MAPNSQSSSSYSSLDDDEYYYGGGSSGNGCSASGYFENSVYVGAIIVNVLLLVIVIILAIILFRVTKRNAEARKILRFSMSIALLFTFLQNALELILSLLYACHVTSYQSYLRSFIATAVFEYLADLIVFAIILLPLITTLRRLAGIPKSTVDVIRPILIGILSVLVGASVGLYCYYVLAYDYILAYMVVLIAHLVFRLFVAIFAGVVLHGTRQGLKANGLRSKHLNGWIQFLTWILLASSLFEVVRSAVIIANSWTTTPGGTLAIDAFRFLIELLVILATIKTAGYIITTGPSDYIVSLSPVDSTQQKFGTSPADAPVAPGAPQSLGQQTQYPYSPGFQQQAPVPPPPAQYYS